MRLVYAGNNFYELILQNEKIVLFEDELKELLEQYKEIIQVQEQIKDKTKKFNWEKEL